MQDKMLILLEQLNMTNFCQAFAGYKLDTVIVDKKTGTYHFYFTTKELIEPHLCLAFYKQLITRFSSITGVNKVLFTTEVNDNSNVNVYDYLMVVKELLQIYDASFMAIDDYDVLQEGNTLYINVKTPEQQALLEALFKQEIEKMYQAIGLSVQFTVRIHENGYDPLEDIEKKRKLQAISVQKQLAEEKREVKQVEVPRTYKNGYNGYKNGTYDDKTINGPIKGDSEPIQNIPVLPDDLPNAKVEYIIEGYIFESEVKKTSQNLEYVEFMLTDYTDSILVQAYPKSEEYFPYYEKILKKGNYVKIKGSPRYKEYFKEVILYLNAAELLDNHHEKAKRTDKGYEGQKRIELHLHTNMSNMDSVTSITQYVDRAVEWGHEAIAVTDHYGVYAFPEFHQATKKKSIKPIYGVEVSLVEDRARIVWNEAHIWLKDATYVIFDIETTGFSVNFDEIIEISAVKLRNGHEIDTFSKFINPHRKLSRITVELTGITDADLLNAPEAYEVLEEFKAFCGDAILVAHNADFDISHIQHAYEKHGLGDIKNPVIDTLEYARNRFGEDVKRFNLKALAKFFKVELQQHHRASFDAKATSEIFLHMLVDMEKQGIYYHDDINNLVGHNEAFKYQVPKHVTILVKNEVGLKNLYKIISDSHTVHLYKEPRVTRSVLNMYREGLLVGSSCSESEVWKTAFEKSYAELKRVAKFYDYLEVQPPEVYSHLIYTTGNENTRLYIIETIKNIIRAGKELGIPVVASGDCHHLDRSDKLYREIYIDTPQIGGGLHPLADSAIKEIPSMHFRTTDEMMQDFDFLTPELAKEIIIDNPKMIADQIEHIKPVKDELYTPSDDFLKHKGIPSIKEEVKRICLERANELYGDPLPAYVQARLDKELNSIIKHGFAVIYYISRMLVKKSLEDGYVVGSRGSVGSSFVATLMEITEVNPLSPHYRCPMCKFSSFKMNEEEKKRFPISELERDLQVILDKVDSGFDLPDASCPRCGTPLKKDGHDIPFETFLGFEGDKVPDIDLNFSGEYQPVMHQYCQEIFGYDKAFRAGTIGTVAEKSAYGYVKSYFEKRNIVKRNPEIKRLAAACQGVKRTTGQHPGGIIVVPDYLEIYDITPIQYPADNPDNTFRTTHFDFHAIHDNLLKLDILGHDDPTMLRYLEDLTGIPPRDVPIDDPKVYQLFCSTESIGVSPERLLSPVASYGIPEFGTNFVRRMLEETKPKTFAELVKISGLSHGTDVWNNNAQDLINGNNPEYGQIDFKSVIGCRDDIMVYLMYFGLEPIDAFNIMEFVRKGKASQDKEKWGKYQEIMRAKNVPEWFIWSCGQIKYMFPKAHATAYVLMAIRIAWFKVNMPIYYYAAYFSKRADAFDVTVFPRGADAIRNRILEIKEKPDASDKENSLVTELEVALEMTERGFYFKQIDLENSLATEFRITEDKRGLIIPFSALDGLGESVAKSIVEARNVRPFISKEDLLNRTSLSKTLVERLEELGCLGNLKETNQISIFDI